MPKPINHSFVKSTRAKIDRAAQAYRDGKSLADAAKIAGVSRQSMWATLRRRNVQMRPQLRFGKDNHFWIDGTNKAPHKLRARKRVNKARRRGKIQPKPCEKCGKPARMSQAHHDDYAKPLNVRWLCRACHFAHHYG